MPKKNILQQGLHVSPVKPLSYSFSRSPAKVALNELCMQRTVINFIPPPNFIEL